jgi:geranylgeranyl diphosphate synthase type I
MLDQLLGDPEITPGQIVLLQGFLTSSGAVDKVEALISQNVAEAEAVLTDSPISEAIRAKLTAFAETVTRRNF